MCVLVWGCSQLFQWDLQRAADHLLHTEGGAAGDDNDEFAEAVPMEEEEEEEEEEPIPDSQRQRTREEREARREQRRREGGTASSASSRAARHRERNRQRRTRAPSPSAAAAGPVPAPAHSAEDEATKLRRQASAPRGGLACNGCSTSVGFRFVERLSGWSLVDSVW